MKRYMFSVGLLLCLITGCATTVDWPDLTVMGVVGKGEKGAVVLGNDIVSSGESLSGITVISVDRSGAVLSFKGQKKLVKVGESTE
jgi:hypothetical protein